MATRAKALIASDRIEQSILILRGHKVLLDSTLARACLNHIHVCDGGNVGCSSRSKFAVIPRVLQELATTKCAPSGRLHRCAACPYSRYGLYIAPCIHPVLAATHHVGIYEIGSKQSRFHDLIELAVGVDYGDFVRTSRACRPGLLATGARYSLCAG